MKCPTCKKDFAEGVEAAYRLGLLGRESGVITASKYHRTLDGTELVRQRESAGLSQGEFAEKCGWSQPFQCRLEAPELHEITTEAAEKIIAVFAEYN